MPRGGAFHGPTCHQIACARCGRIGTYRRETLAVRLGDAVLTALAACPLHGDFSEPCGVRYVEPLARLADGIDRR